PVGDVGYPQIALSVERRTLKETVYHLSRFVGLAPFGSFGLPKGVRQACKNARLDDFRRGEVQVPHKGRLCCYGWRKGLTWAVCLRLALQRSRPLFHPGSAS